jgi:hypothetical protein
MTTVQENIAFQQAVKAWGEAMLPHLFPGAIVLMFAGLRMWEWLATGMQMAGFEHWDSFCWLHAQGFPDEIAGVEQDPHYCEIANGRLNYWQTESCRCGEPYAAGDVFGAAEEA